MAGFENDVMVAKNLNFDETAAKPHLGIINAAGKFPIGTGNTFPTPEILGGKITSPLGTLTIGYSSPNITLDISTLGNYISLSPFIVGTDSHSGYSTITAAITAAVAAGATNTTPMNVYIKPKADGTSYTENLTLQPGVNLIGFGLTPTIIGKLTYTQAGTVNIDHLTLQTNSDFLLAVTGSAASVVKMRDCRLNCTNNTGISHTASNTSSSITMDECFVNVSTTGIALYSKSSTGSIVINCSRLSNSGSSSTANTDSAGSSVFYYSLLPYPFSVSNAATISAQYCEFQTVSTNTTTITTAGTGTSNILQCIFSSGTASAMSIGAGTTATVTFCQMTSSNANVLTGAGTLNYAFIAFPGSSSGHNVTVENALATLI